MQPVDWNNHLPRIPALQLGNLNQDNDSDGLEPSIDPESSIDLSGYGQVDFAVSAHSSVHNTDPPTYAAAMKHPDAKQWQEAAEAEMNNHFENGTWEYVPKPPDAKIIGSKWVFVIKHKSDESIEQHKGHIIAQGYAQQPGFEYAEDATFSPTYRPASLRLILALAAQNKLHLCSVDISAAFLLGTNITEEIYLCQPPGFH